MKKQPKIKQLDEQEQEMKELMNSKPEVIDFDKVVEAGEEFDIDERDEETITSLGGPLQISGIEFPPPTACYLCYLELIQSPFYTGREEVTADDVVKALYLLKYREKGRSGCAVDSKWKEWLKFLRKYYEKYLQNAKTVLALSPFGEDMYRFGESLGKFSYVEAAKIISQHVDIALGGFGLIPDDPEAPEHKKKESSTANG